MKNKKPQMTDGALLAGRRPSGATVRQKLVVISAIAVSQAAAAQVTAIVVKIQSPAFLVWFSTGWNALLLPVAFAAARHTPASLPPCRSHLAVQDAFLALPFFMLWASANLLYVEALAGLSPPLVSALFAFTPVLVALLSVPMLGRRLTALALTACIVAASGVTLIARPWRAGDHAPPTNATAEASVSAVAATAATALADAFPSAPPAPSRTSEAVAALCVIGASVCAALYKVLFRRWHGDCPASRVFSVLGYIGLFSLIVGTPLLVALDPHAFAAASACDTTAWLGICARAAIDLAFNFSIAWGISLVHPLFISIGTLLSTPLNVLATFALHGTVPVPLEWLGMMAVLCGFALILADERRAENASKAAEAAESASGDHDGHGPATSATPCALFSETVGAAAGGVVDSSAQ